jgi:hypothetical protein
MEHAFSNPRRVMSIAHLPGIEPGRCVHLLLAAARCQPPDCLEREETRQSQVGGSQTIRGDVGVIAATNRDLAGSIAAGAFRNDLFYRLNDFPI